MAARSVWGRVVRVQFPGLRPKRLPSSLVEQRSEEPRVPGSIPGVATKICLVCSTTNET